MNKDKMTNRERWEAVLAGERPDRVPVFAWMHDHIAGINGMETLNTDPKGALQAHIQAQKLYGYDSPPLFVGKLGVGGMLAEKDGKLGKAEPNSIQTIEDADKLVIPEEMHKTGNTVTMFEFSQLQEQAGLPEITFFFRDPFSMAGTLFGLDNLMMKTIEDPAVIHRVMEKCTQLLIDYTTTWVREFGPERLMPVYASALTSNKLISPKHFEEFALPYAKRVLENFRAVGIKKGIAHLCSEQTRNLPLWSTVDFPEQMILSFGHEVDLLEAAAALPNSIIAGNIEPLILFERTPDEVNAECKRIIERAKEIKRGYFMMPGCDVPPKSNPVNINQMILAARAYGQY